MQINPINCNSSHRQNFKSNITFDIGGSQREGSCKIYRRDSFGKNHLIGVVSAAKKFKTPSVSFQQNVGPILGNKRRQEDRL